MLDAGLQSLVKIDEDIRSLSNTALPAIWWQPDVHIPDTLPPGGATLQVDLRTRKLVSGDMMYQIQLGHYFNVRGVVTLFSYVLVVHDLDPHVCVYREKKLTQKITVPGMKDMTGMVVLRETSAEATVVISDVSWKSEALHFVTVSSDCYLMKHKSSKLSFKPHDISLGVTADTLLLTDRDKKTLYMYNHISGETKVCLHLPKSAVDDPWCSVQTSEGYIVVDCGSNTVVHVDGQGTVLHTYGKGLQDQPLDAPIHLAVDDAGNVLIADHVNDRLQLIDANRRFIRHTVEVSGYPIRLHLDKDNDTLYVSHLNEEYLKENITVFHYSSSRTKKMHVHLSVTVK